MKTWIGGCVGLIKFVWADHLGGLGWRHQGVKVAQSWPSKLGSNSVSTGSISMLYNTEIFTDFS